MSCCWLHKLIVICTEDYTATCPFHNLMLICLIPHVLDCLVLVLIPPQPRPQCAVGFIYAHVAGSWCTECFHGCCTRWQVIIHVGFTNLCYCVRAAFTWRHKSRAKGRQDASKGGLQCLGICVVACRATRANTVLRWASTFPRPNVHHATGR